jgi:hypothetical protein
MTAAFAIVAAWATSFVAFYLGRLTERKVWLDKSLSYELERGELLDAEHDVRRAEFAIFGSLLKESHPEIVARMEGLLARLEALRARRGKRDTKSYAGACRHADDRIFSNVHPAMLCADCGAWRMDHDDAWRLPRRAVVPDSQPDPSKERA